MLLCSLLQPLVGMASSSNPPARVGVLFARSAVLGEQGYGYFTNSDPAWFVWKGTHSTTTDKLLYRALLSPAVRFWHVVARCKPTGKWRYRGAYTRHTCFETPEPAAASGMLLSRFPSQDIAEPHTSLQEPLPIQCEYLVNLPMAPLSRAKYSMAQLLDNRFFAKRQVVGHVFTEGLDLWVYNTSTHCNEQVTFYMNLLLDEVRHYSPPCMRPKAAQSAMH